MGGERKKILVIDDYRPFAHSLKHALGPEFEVTLALSADEALAALRGAKFDAVLCDVALDGRSGDEVQRAAPESVRDRFIFLSGSATALSPAIGKPFEIEQVHAALARLWNPTAP